MCFIALSVSLLEYAVDPDEYADGSIPNHTQWVRRPVIRETRHAGRVEEAGVMETWWKQTKEETAVLGAKRWMS